MWYTFYMRVLGIDPGLAIVGYGILDEENGRCQAIDCGVITTSKNLTLPQRLIHIDKMLNELIDTYKPDVAAIEELFFTKNTKTAIAVAEARGVTLNVLQKAMPDKIYEYTPNQIKESLTGYGGADKKQMQEMIRIVLKLQVVPKPDDAADALAIALCHAQTSRLLNSFKIQ